MAVLRIPGAELERIMRDIDCQFKKIDAEISITKELVNIIQKANERETKNPPRDPGGSDPLGKAGAKPEKTV